MANSETSHLYFTHPEKQNAMGSAGDWVHEYEVQHAAPHRYVMPYLQYGPNNQYLQLMEAAVVARALSRALVAPRFNAWVNDESESRGRTVEFSETFDVAAVSQCVPLASTADVMRAGMAGHPLFALSDYKRAERFLAAQRLPCCPRRGRLRKQRLASEAQVQQLVAGDHRASHLVVGWHSFFAVERGQRDPNPTTRPFL